MKRVAIYCRVSSDKQKEKDTIENQVDILKTYVEMKEDLKIFNEFLDDGVSGTIDFTDRPAGKRIIESAKKKEFDTLLVYKIDRLGRDTLSGLNAAEILTNYGIEIISVTEPFDLNTPVGRFQFINYLNMAELERNNILDRMYLGATRAAKQGKWMGGIVPYGYYKNKDGYLEINEYEANVVRKIYDLYINENMNTFHIALYLVNLGIDSNYAARGVGKYNKEKAKSLWSNTSVLRILTASTYKGIHEYGKRGTRRKELIVREVPPIVPIEVWEQAQRKKRENQKGARRNSPNKLFTLRGLLKCGECGKSYSGIYYRKQPSVYSCRGKLGVNRKLYGIKCNGCNINAIDTEEFIWSTCKTFMESFNDIIDNSKDNKEEELKLELEGLSSKLSSVKGEKNNILKLFRKDLITEEELDEQLKDVKKEEDKLNERASEIKNKLSLFSDKDKEIENTKDYINFYKDRLDKLSDEEKMKVMNELINEILVTNVIEEGKKIPSFDIHFKITDLLSATTTMQIISQYNEEKNLPIKYKKINAVGRGRLLINLRLKQNKFCYEVAKEIGVNKSVLALVEKGRYKKPYKYYHLYCNHFRVNPITYLKLFELPEDTLKEKVLKLEAYLGLNSHFELDNYLGLKRKTIGNSIFKYNAGKTGEIKDVILKVETALDELKKHIN